MIKFINKKILISIICAITISSSVFAYTSEEIKQSIIRQSKTLGVEPAIMLSIAKTESGFRQNITSSAGHIGVFQLSPATAKHMGINPYNLEDNIKGGITYYKNMYNKFGSMELAVAAYNSGPDAIKRCNYNVPSASKSFVTRIMKDYNSYKQTGL